MSYAVYPSLSLVAGPSAVDETHGSCPTTHLSVVVSADDDPQSLDQKLSKAVNRLIPAALERRQGILVTQHGLSNYTVEVDANIPCGAIHELRC